MKKSYGVFLIIVAVCIFFGAIGVIQADPLGTAFTYRGQLADTGTPANGTYDFEFRLYDALALGGQVGTTQTKGDIQVSNGMFVIDHLDFGLQFPGQARWLEIGVRPGTSTSAYTLLSPRVALRPIPYSLYAASSGNAESVSWTSLVNIPPSLIDGVDNDTLAGLPCSSGQVPKWNGSNWACAADGDTTYTAAVGLTLTGNQFSVNTGTIQARVTGTCGTGQAIRVINANGTVTCESVGGGGLTLPYSGNLVGSFSGFAVTHNGSGNALWGKSVSNTAVWGESTSSGFDHAGVVGKNWSGSGIGVVGTGYPIGVNGEAHSSGGMGVRGVSNASNGTGVYGEALTGSNASGVTGMSTEGVGGYFQGQIGLHGLGVNGVGVKGSSVVANNAGVYGGNSTGGNGVYGLSATGPGITAVNGQTGNYVDLGTPTSAIKAVAFSGLAGEFVGRLKTKVLEITGGADLSENFDIRDFISGIKPSPGLVVSIDMENPGKLKVSQSPYDRRVAGIISGANGVNSGMLMGQYGTLADGKYPVALTGRVYCWVDAGGGPIEPGDLLTTSDIPGHAMKVGDYGRAQGAIIGKAMTKLSHGKGLILVLVSLQ